MRFVVNFEDAWSVPPMPAVRTIPRQAQCVPVFSESSTRAPMWSFKFQLMSEWAITALVWIVTSLGMHLMPGKKSLICNYKNHFRDWRKSTQTRSRTWSIFINSTFQHVASEKPVSLDLVARYCLEDLIARLVTAAHDIRACSLTYNATFSKNCIVLLSIAGREMRIDRSGLIYQHLKSDKRPRARQYPRTAFMFSLAHSNLQQLSGLGGAVDGDWEY